MFNILIELFNRVVFLNSVIEIIFVLLNGKGKKFLIFCPPLYIKRV